MCAEVDSGFSFWNTQDKTTFFSEMPYVFLFFEECLFSQLECGGKFPVLPFYFFKIVWLGSSELGAPCAMMTLYALSLLVDAIRRPLLVKRRREM